MKVFMEIVGADMPIANLKVDHFDQFKKARYEAATGEYRRKGWEIDQDKVKRGVNKDLMNIRTVLRGGANKDIGEALLAFWIFRYTGARRSEIVRKRLNDNSRGSNGNISTGCGTR